MFTRAIMAASLLFASLVQARAEQIEPAQRVTGACVDVDRAAKETAERNFYRTIAMHLGEGDKKILNPADFHLVSTSAVYNSSGNCVEYTFVFTAAED